MPNLLAAACVRARAIVGAVALAFTLGTLVACRSPYIVVRQASPNPFASARSFTIEPISFESAIVSRKTESDWLAARSPAQRGSWDADKIAMTRAFDTALIHGATNVRVTNGPARGSDYVTIRPMIMRLEPGMFASGLVAWPSWIVMRVQLLDPIGGVLDEFEIDTVVEPSIVHPSIGGRMRIASDRLGALTARYLRIRAGGG